MFQNKVAQNKTLIIAVAFVAIGVVGYMLPAANVASAQYYDYYPSDYEYTNTYYDTYDYYPSDYGYSDTYYDTYDYYPSDYGYSDDYYPSDYGYDNYDCVNCYGGGGYTPPSYNYPTGCGSSCGSTYQPPVYQPPVYQYPTYTYPSNTNIVNSGNSDDDTNIINNNDTIINNNNNTNTNIIGNGSTTPCYYNCTPPPPPPCTSNCNPEPTYPPTVDLRVDDNIVDEGDSTTLRWDSTNADYCFASGDWSGTKDEDDSESTGRLFNDETYRITCYNNSDSDDDSVTVRVEDRDVNNDQL